jgi:hypothetical protein
MSVLSPVVDYFDGANRRIHLLQGVTQFHWITDIYAEYRHWRRTDEAAQKWFPLMKADGNIPKGGGKFTPRYLTLLNGTRLVPYDEANANAITTTGEAITDNPEVDPNPFDLSTLSNPIQIYITPSEAEIIVINGSGGGSGASAAEIWAHPSRTLSAAGNNAVADTVWDESLNDHQNAGSSGKKLKESLKTGEFIALK